MGELIKKQYIDREKLNRGHYFQALLIEAVELGVIDHVQAEKIQMNLMYLLKKQIYKYTSGESSSVRIEKAQQIAQSINYCIGAYLKTIPDVSEQVDVLKQKEIEYIFTQGMDTIKRQVEAAKALLKDVQDNFMKVNNQAYYDTIFIGIPPFFLQYDINYAAHEIPASIDYPLSNDKMDLLGVEYLYEYLLHLNMENEFSNRFSEDAIIKLLSGYSKNYKEDLINLYEIILRNVIGQRIVGKTSYDLEITIKDKDKLTQILKTDTEDNLKKRLKDEFIKLCSELEIADNNMIEYLQRVMKPLSVRIKHNLELDKLETIFVTPKEHTEIVKSFYQDGQQMNDEELRRLIRGLNGCQNISDKIVMVQQTVSSLRDLIEIMKECFYGDEIDEVYKLLSDSELKELKKME